MQRIIYIVVLMSFLSACKVDTKMYSSSANATGTIDEVVIIMEPSNWKGELGDSARLVFAAPYNVLPQNEPTFDLRYVKPAGFKSLLQMARNVIIIGALNRDKTTAKAFEIFKKENLPSDKNLAIKRNMFTQGQQIAYIYGETPQEVLDFLHNNAAYLVDKVASNENQKLKGSIYLGGKDLKLTKLLKEKLNIDLEIPKGYKLAKVNENDIWLRYDEKGNTINLLFRKEALNTNADAGILARNDMGKKYIKGHTDGSFMETEDLLPYVQTTTKINNLNAVESKGLWSMSKDFLGGPFVNYVIKNPNENTQLIVDGFVKAPTEKKRLYMRKLERLFHQIEMN